MGFDNVISYSLTLLRGASTTLGITLGALLIALVLGLIFGVIKAFGRIKIVNFLIDVYIEIFRGVPALAILFILYFGLGYAGLRLDALSAAILGLGLIGGAMLTEVFRAGFVALHFGQREAALAIGMTPLMALRYILLPQAATFGQLCHRVYSRILPLFPLSPHLRSCFMHAIW